MFVYCGFELNSEHREKALKVLRYPGRYPIAHGGCSDES